jgi:hypothetical protein
MDVPHFATPHKSRQVESVWQAMHRASVRNEVWEIQTGDNYNPHFRYPGQDTLATEHLQGIEKNHGLKHPRA